MSTRSRIGIKDPKSGKIRSVYCHSDGYFEGVGLMLHRHYRDTAKIKALIALGDLSTLDKQVAPPAGVPHHFDGPRAEGVTVAYHRDRSEELIKSEISKGEAGFLAATDACSGEFAYLWDLDKWRVWCLHEGSPIQGSELVVEMVTEVLS